MTYYAIIDRTLAGRYAVRFPDLSGCEAEGDTIPDAQARAGAVIATCLAEMAEPPAPRERDDLLKDAKVKSAIAGGSLLVAVEPKAEPASA